MPARHVLYLTQHQLFAFRWHHGALSPEGEFLAEMAAGDFSGYLASHGNDLFTLVVNLGEEGFQSDVIPYLQSRDRAAVIARRLGQNFQGAPLAIAIPHGHESGSRKNERLLLTALTGTSQLSPWIDAIHRTATRLQGIYSLPLLSEKLIQALGIKISRGILITLQDNTIRQSFFRDQRLLFSRVAPLSGSGISDVALAISAEANRFQQYLLSQRLVARGDHLAAHVIAHPHAIPAIQAARFNDGINLTVHDVLAAAKKLRLKTPPGDHRSQSLFLHCAITNPPPLQFATPALRQPYRLWQLGNALRAGGALIFAASLMFTFKLIVESQRDIGHTRDRVRDAETMEQSYQNALSSLPPIPMSNDVLRQLIERLDQQANKTTDSPARALHQLSRALEAVPAVEVSQINWQARGMAAADKPAAATSAGADTETLTVKGTILPGPQGTPRQILNTIETFAGHLRNHPPGTKVTIQQNPVDLNANRAAGSTASSQTAARQFALQIEYPVQP